MLKTGLVGCSTCSTCGHTHVLHVATHVLNVPEFKCRPNTYEQTTAINFQYRWIQNNVQCITCWCKIVVVQCNVAEHTWKIKYTQRRWTWIWNSRVFCFKIRHFSPKSMNFGRIVFKNVCCYCQVAIARWISEAICYASTIRTRRWIAKQLQSVFIQCCVAQRNGSVA